MEEARETATSTIGQFGALSTESEAGEREILDGTRQDSSEDAKQAWHDEGGPDSFASVVKDGNASRRRQASMSMSSRIVRKLGICDWSEKAWDLAMANLLVDTTNQRFKEEVPGTAVVNISRVSGGMFVSVVSAVQADASQPTLRIEVLRPGNLATKSVSCAGSHSTFHAEVQVNETHTVTRYTNSHARFGTEDMHGQKMAVSWFTESPLGSLRIPPLVVVMTLEMQQTQTVYAFIDEGSLSESSGSSLMGLGNRESNVVVTDCDMPSRGGEYDDHHWDLVHHVRGTFGGRS